MTVGPSGQPVPPGQLPLAEQIQVSQAELVATMTELMKDEVARRTLELSAGNLAAGYADAVADRYLAGVKSGSTAPDPEVLWELSRQGQEVGRFLCATVEAIGGEAKADAKQAIEALAGMRLGADVAFEATKLGTKGLPGGPLVEKGAEQLAKLVRKPYDDYVDSLESQQWAIAGSNTDAAHSMAEAVVWDSMATALLNRAVAAPPDHRDQLLAELGVHAVASDGTRLTGTAALRDAGLLNADGHFTLPRLGTAEYGRYKTWLSHEAAGFASRVDVLVGPARAEFTTCVARHLDVQDKGKE